MLALLVVILYKKITELRVHKLCCQSKLNKSGLPVCLTWGKEFLQKFIITHCNLNFCSTGGYKKQVMKCIRLFQKCF